MRHLTTSSLIAYAEASRAGRHQGPDNEHIGNCPPCFVESLEWAGLLKSLGSPGLQEPPEYATRNCLTIYQRPKPVSVVRQIMAAIVFDSALAPEACGVRGASDARQVRLCAG